MLVDAAVVQVISAAGRAVDHPLTGLQPKQFRKLDHLAARRGGDQILDGRPARPAVSPRPAGPGPAGRRLLAHQPDHAPDRTAVRYLRSAAHRVIDTLGPLLALAPLRCRPIDQVTIVDGTLIPTRDHTLAAARSKNYRYSTNLQVAIDADTRLVAALASHSQATATTSSSTAPAASTGSWPAEPRWLTAPTAAIPK